MTTCPISAIRPVSIPLSGEWCFSIDKDQVGEQQGWENPDFDDSSWATIGVPHTWNVMSEHSENEGLAWYRRSFTIPNESRDAYLRLRFEAVFYLARVWLNGQYLGQHEGGYTPFEFDVTSVIISGEKNVIAVQVDNLRATNRIPVDITPDWSFDWWNYGGIRRDVSLEITSQAYIARQQIVSVPHLSGIDEADSVTVTATININNTSDSALDATIQADLLDDANGQSVLTSSASTLVNVPANNHAEVQITVSLASPKLWHFDHPNLYRWSASVRGTDGQVLHANEVTTGVRSVELKDGYLYVHGEPVRLVGVTRHADYPGQGSAETVTAMAADYEDSKILNQVLSRPVHYPQHKFILDYADRHGILLIPEVPAWQLTQEQMYMEVFRSKPFVAGAIFWTYQDYRTRSEFIMGLVDFNRNRRGSWEILREQYAPALIDSIRLSPTADEKLIATIVLHTRGPGDADMPAYTLRAYTLHWVVISADGSTEFSEGTITLPTLSPASQWSGKIQFTAPAEEYRITMSIIRPTGYSVIERSYSGKGELIP